MGKTKFEFFFTIKVTFDLVRLAQFELRHESSVEKVGGVKPQLSKAKELIACALKVLIDPILLITNESKDSHK